jgi:hypothetical protein
MPQGVTGVVFEGVLAAVGVVAGEEAMTADGEDGPAAPQAETPTRPVAKTKP